MARRVYRSSAPPRGSLAMDVERRQVRVVEHVDQIGAVVAGDVAGRPLLGVPEAALAGRPAGDADAGSRRQVDIDRGEAAVVEHVGEVGAAVAVEVAGGPLLGVPEAALAGRPARDAN